MKGVVFIKFFEKPARVTALVFFLETILSLMKVEYFLFLDFGQLLISIILLTLLPFGFHAVYSYILTDLKKKDDQILNISKDSSPVPSVETSEEVGDTSSVKDERIDLIESLEHDKQGDESVTSKVTPDEKQGWKSIEKVGKKPRILSEEELMAKKSLEPVATKQASPSRLERKKSASSKKS